MSKIEIEEYDPSLSFKTHRLCYIYNNATSMLNFRLLPYFILMTVLIPSYGYTQKRYGENIPDGFDHYRSNIPHGTIDTIYYPSQTVGATRKAIIYYPPVFREGRKYPVLFLLHGIGGDEKEWLKSGQPERIFDNLYAQGKLEPMIVVMPNGRAMIDDRAVGNLFDSLKVAAFSTFEEDLLHDLLPFVEQELPILANKKHRAIAGLSMGGGQALNIGLGNTNQFAWIGGFSSAPNMKPVKELVPDPGKLSEEIELLWISCGDQDGLLVFSQLTHKFLQEHKVPHIYHIEPGGHDYWVWKNNLYLFSQLLFKEVEPSLFGD